MYKVHEELVGEYDQIPEHYRESMEQSYGVTYGFPDPDESSSVHFMQVWVNNYWHTGEDFIQQGDTSTPEEKQAHFAHGRKMRKIFGLSESQ